jgi:hypothetical protein
MNEYGRMPLVPVLIPLSEELIAKLRGEHWNPWPPQETLPRVKPLLEAIERRNNGHREKWVEWHHDALRAYYGTRKEEP